MPTPSESPFQGFTPLVKVKRKGQMTLPRTLREQFGLHEGDYLKAEAVPDGILLKPVGTSMSDALVEMSSKGFGCVGIVDAHGTIAGIVTDGDLRRHMRPDLMTALVDEVMTRNPKTIGRDLLASEALEILNSSKITALLVTDANKPVGIVHLHDILRAGVA